MTCGSERLAEHLRTSLSNTTVQVDTFPTLARRLGTEAGKLSKGASFSLESAPELVFDSLAARPDLAFDAVIVDESQDFAHPTWIAIDALANRTGDAILHAYFDSNQRLYGELRAQFESYNLSPIRLSRNLRNTQNIHHATQPFYRGPALTADGPVGSEVRWIPSDEDRIVSAAADEIRRLLNVERVSPSDISLLCVTSRSTKDMELRLEESAKAGMTVCTIADFKGLENRFVVLLATKDLADLAEQAYVALSRARVHLSVIGSEGVLSWLRNGTSEG
jgi:hypothetical protein